MKIKSNPFNLVFWWAVFMIFYLDLLSVFDRNGETRVERYPTNESVHGMNRKTSLSSTIIKHTMTQSVHQAIKIKPVEINITSKITGCISWPNLYFERKDLALDKRNYFPNIDVFAQDRVFRKINCRQLFDGNATEHRLAMERMKNLPLKQIQPNVYLNKTRHCDKYINETGYISSSLTEEEENFPIGYSILVFKNIQQVETLLRSIYRPQNVYCIHCDKKASADFKEALQSITRCFDNVFMSSKSYDVVWGTISVLLPEITCMGDLWKYNKKWKYFINLTGQEFPLRTNYELVKILKIYNGSNDIDGTVKRANKERWEGKPKLPYNIRYVKGSVHIVASRGYVDYVLHNKIADDILNWTAGVQVPDEMFFATINHNPSLNVPGSNKGEPETDCRIKPFLTRFKNWGDHVFNWKCHGKRVRQICIFGIGDLPLLASRQEMFANKFHFDYQPYTYQCMDELIFNRTRDEYFNQLKFNTSKYQSLEFIKNTI